MTDPGYARASDEFDVQFNAQTPLGLDLRDLTVFTNPTAGGSSRVLVGDIAPGGQAESKASIVIDMIVVAVDGTNVENERSEEVVKRIAKLRQAWDKSFSVTFKDPVYFQNALVDPLPKGTSELVVSTALVPSVGRADAQVFAVERREVPLGARRPAVEGDLLEIAYEGRFVNGTKFDGMQLAKRQGDGSVQFVLGKQPPGQFPPAWDVGLVGMCCGEVRVLSVPPVLGYGPKGYPKRGIPPNAQLVYEVELIAINANTAP